MCAARTSTSHYNDKHHRFVKLNYLMCTDRLQNSSTTTSKLQVPIPRYDTTPRAIHHVAWFGHYRRTGHHPRHGAKDETSLWVAATTPSLPSTSIRDGASSVFGPARRPCAMSPKSLLITYVALNLMDSYIQPALLYSVPFHARQGRACAAADKLNILRFICLRL